jgi:hypothetical protein
VGDDGWLCSLNRKKLKHFRCGKFNDTCAKASMNATISPSATWWEFQYTDFGAVPDF